jgi:hypothetical protein
MNLKKVLIAGVLLLLAASAYVWFFVYNKPHEDIDSAKADFKVSVVDFVKEFETNHDAAWEKYHDKVIELDGEVASVLPNDSISSVIFKAGNNYEVFCEVYPQHNAEAKLLAPQQKTSVKGLFVNAEKPDEMLEITGILRLKKTSLVKQ